MAYTRVAWAEPGAVITITTRAGVADKVTVKDVMRNERGDVLALEYGIDGHPESYVMPWREVLAICVHSTPEVRF